MIQNTILVTGAGRRIGFHLAKRLYEEGYSVLAHYRSETDDSRSLAVMGIPLIQADFSNTESIMSFIDAVKEKCSSLRGIIHNASSYECTSDDLWQAAEQYEQFFNVHMKAPFLLNQALLPLLEKNDSADIVHITDINVENPTPKFEIYGTTKAGLHNLTLAQAKKFAPKVKVNAIAPGPVLFSDMHTDDAIEQTLNETLLGREGGEEPVFQAVKSVIENDFMTGAILPVDGGRRLTKR